MDASLIDSESNLELAEPLQEICLVLQQLGIRILLNIYEEGDERILGDCQSEKNKIYNIDTVHE